MNASACARLWNFADLFTDLGSPPPALVTTSMSMNSSWLSKLNVASTSNSCARIAVYALRYFSSSSFMRGPLITSVPSDRDISEGDSACADYGEDTPPALCDAIVGELHR